MRFLKIISAAFLVSCSPQEQGKDAGKVSDSNSSSEDNTNQDLIMSDLLTAFWNVENLFDFEDDPKTRDNDFLPDGKYKWTESKYYQKLDRIAQVMNDFGDELPHLMGLVEVENLKVLEDLVKHDDIRKAGYKIVHKESKDHET